MLRIAYIGLALLACLLCAAAIWWYKDLGVATEIVVVALVVNMAATVIGILVLEERLRQVVRSEAFRASLGAAASFWKVARPNAAWTVLFGGRAPDASDPHLRLSYSTFASFGAIQRVLRELYGPELAIDLKHVSAVKDWAQAAGGNIVVLGGTVSIPELSQILPFYGLSLDRGEESKGPVMKRSFNLRDGEVAKGSFATEGNESDVESDWGLVTRLIDEENGSALFTFSGGMGPGTEACVSAMTQARHTHGLSFDGELLAAIVEVTGIADGRCGPRSVLKVRESWSRSIGRKPLQELRERLASGVLAPQPAATAQAAAIVAREGAGDSAQGAASDGN